MSEVVVVAVVPVKPGKEAEAEEAFRSLLDPSHAEPGCVKYALHRAHGEPTRFVMVEKWASMEALGQHGQSPHMKDLGRIFADLAAEPAQILVLEPLAGGDPDKGRL